MPTAQDFRRMMDECLRSAAEAASEEERNAFLQMAQTWQCAALEIESREHGTTARAA
jgi:hypothetical protein